MSTNNWRVYMEQRVERHFLDQEDLELYSGPKGNVLTYYVSGDDLESAKDDFHMTYPISCLDDWLISFVEIT